MLREDAISIHALREEGDLLQAACTRPPWIFLSTPSARRATAAVLHLLRSMTRFLSTPSARRATIPSRQGLQGQGISIHALREEGDPFSAVRFWLQKVFLSTPSARRATVSPKATVDITKLFLSTPSARRATEGAARSGAKDDISIHALREEGDHLQPPADDPQQQISIHALREEGDSKNRDKISIFL